MAGNGSELTIDTLPAGVGYDVTATLKELGQIDPKLRRAATARMKGAARPLVQEAKSLVPQDTGLSGWGNWTTPKGRVIGPYNGAAVRKGIKVVYKGPSKKQAGREIFHLLTLQNTTAAGAIYDIAGRANGSGRNSEGAARGRAFINKLRQNGMASRIVWRAAEAKQDEVVQAVEKAVRDMEREVQERI